jgi:hypothetical protein
MIQYSFLGRTAASMFCLRMGTELVPKPLYSNDLTRLCARENYIEYMCLLPAILMAQYSKKIGYRHSMTYEQDTF